MPHFFAYLMVLCGQKPDFLIKTLVFGVHFGVHILISFSPYIINTNEKLNILKTSLIVKIIQSRVKHAKVLPCVFFIPLRMRVRDNIIILYTEVDSKHFCLLQPFILKAFSTLSPSSHQSILPLSLINYIKTFNHSQANI